MGIASISTKKFLKAYNDMNISNAQLMKKFKIEWRDTHAILRRAECAEIGLTVKRTGGAAGTVVSLLPVVAAPVVVAPVVAAPVVVNNDDEDNDDEDNGDEDNGDEANGDEADEADDKVAEVTVTPIAAHAWKFQATVYGVLYTFGGTDQRAALLALTEKLIELDFSKGEVKRNSRAIGLLDIRNGDDVVISKTLTAA